MINSPRLDDPGFYTVAICNVKTLIIKLTNVKILIITSI